MLSRRDRNGTGNVHMLSRRDGNGTGRWEFFIDEGGTGIEYGSGLSDGMGWDYHVL